MLSTSQEVRLYWKSNLLAFWSWSSQPPEQWEMKVSCYSHLIYGHFVITTQTEYVLKRKLIQRYEAAPKTAMLHWHCVIYCVIQLWQHINKGLLVTITLTLQMREWIHSQLGNLIKEWKSNAERMVLGPSHPHHYIMGVSKNCDDHQDRLFRNHEDTVHVLHLLSLELLISDRLLHLLSLELIHKW